MKNYLTKYRIGIFACVVIACPSAKSEECCGNKPMPDPPKICCEQKIIDPSTPQTVSWSVDVSAMVNAFENAVNTCQINGNGCQWQPGGSLSISVSGNKHSECCDEKITSIYGLKANASLAFGSFTCQANLTSGLPDWLVSIGIFIGIDASYVIKGLDISNSCEKKKLSIDLDGVKVGVSGGAQGQLGAGFVKITAGVRGSGQAGFTISKDEDNGEWGLSNRSVRFNGVEAFINVRYLYGAFTDSYTKTIF